MAKVDSSDFLGLTVSDEKEMKKEFAVRRYDKYFKTVTPSRVEAYKSEGWRFDKKLKSGIKIHKDRPVDEVVENKAWCLMYRMGYSELNQGRNFKIQYKLEGNSYSSKQIDVFAKDDDTIVIIECKSAIEYKPKQMSKDLTEYAQLRRKLSNSIRSYYGNGFKPKIIWMFFTWNIQWSKIDIEKAKDLKIKVVTEREYDYINQIVNHLGHAAKYQFLAEYCGGEEIPNMKGKPIPAIKGRLGGRFFYSFVTTPDRLLKIAFVNHRALDDPKGVPTYQRLVQKSRIKDLEDFIRDGGYFPNNILLNFTHNLSFERLKKSEEDGVEFGLLHLPPKYKTAWVIDGQHRLYGFANLSEEERKKSIFVLAFERMPKHEEANLFVTINHTQKSVPPGLLDDLEGDLKWGSEQPNEKIGAICARLIRNAGASIGDPFYGRIVAQGIKGSDSNCLTLRWLKQGFKESGLIGKSLQRNRRYEGGPLTDVSDELTLEKAFEFVNDFFSEVRGANPERWDVGRPGFLCTNPGVCGYLMLAAALIEHAASEDGLRPENSKPHQINDAIFKYMDPVLFYVAESSDEAFQSKFKVDYGATGPRQYYWCLCEIINDCFRDFSPSGFHEWKENISSGKVSAADSQVRFIHSVVPEYVFYKLRAVSGDDPDYLAKCVPNVKVLSRATEKRAEGLKKGDSLPLEAYFDFIDVASIAVHPSNWKHVKAVLSVPRKGNNKSEQIKWLDRINSLRRIAAHPSPDRVYAQEDFEFLGMVCEELDYCFEMDGFEPKTQMETA